MSNTTTQTEQNQIKILKSVTVVVFL